MNQAAPMPAPLWEIISVTISCFIAEWIVMAFAGNSKVVGAIPVGLALALMFLSHRERGDSAHAIGFRLDNFGRAVRLLVLPTIILAAAIVLVSWYLRGNDFAFASVRLRFLSLPLWALFQQYALNGFINRRAELTFGKGFKSIALVAVIFSLVHFPNPLLMALTLVGGVLWASVYQRVPNLFALALSHALASLVVTLSLSPMMVNGLRVGLKYFR